MTTTPAALAYLPAVVLANNLDVVRGSLWDGAAAGNLYFGVWLALTDRRVQRRVGLGLLDLADAPLRDWFDDGIQPSEAASLVLAADDTFGGAA